MSKGNIFKSSFDYKIEYEKEWEYIEIKSEKELQTFLVDNISWTIEVIKRMFKFTTLEYIGREYRVPVYGVENKCYDIYDLCFKHGEDIVIVELKYGYGAESSKCYYQLKDYKRRFEKNYTNKVYRVLITNYVTFPTLELMCNEKEEIGIMIFNMHRCYINFEKSQLGTLGGEKN